ncbi:MAG: hypothetical protein EBZ76_05190 [Synechococcaceae bacterium WB9_2_170]|nr:hypothetical protein [Synechococcaceae bacterium WB9_2_170]
MQHRLSEQLQALTQVGETLTLRLLDLEERLGTLEGHLAELQEAQGVEQGGLDSGDILAITEERIARLEDLLTEQRQVRSANVQELTVQELNPFPEEDEEQPFMDELCA